MDDPLLLHWGGEVRGSVVWTSILEIEQLGDKAPALKWE